MSEELRKANDALSACMDAEMPRPEGKETWAYRDLPQIIEPLFTELVERIGEENIYWLTKASYTHADGVYRRGQMFVSPQGLDNVRAMIAERKNPN